MEFQPSSMSTNISPFSFKDESVKLMNIKQQIETILSIDNMAQTLVLPSYMDEDGFISISTLLALFPMNFSGITIEDVIKAVKDSDSVVINLETYSIRPNVPVERKTIILRDMDSDITEEDIRNIFNGIETVTSIKPPVGNNWFVVMDTEEHALSALHTLQSMKYHDQAIHARIKNETRIMVINRLIESKVPDFPTMMYNSMYFGSYNPSSSSVFSSATMTSTPSVEFDHTSKNPKRRQKNKQHHRKNQPATKPIPLPQLSNKNAFPPLVFTGNQSVGYTGSFIHYSPEEILTIVKDMKDLSLPTEPIEDVSSIMMKEPNSELVTKQRTFSIDQSIESGMPRTYSVDSVDYTTMLMGDMEEEEKEEVRKKRKEWKSHKIDYSKVLGKKTTENDKNGKEEQKKKDHRRKGEKKSANK